jgi:hypothetical protein
MGKGERFRAHLEYPSLYFDLQLKFQPFPMTGYNTA